MKHPSFTRETKPTKYGQAHKTRNGRWRVYIGRRISKRTGKSIPFYAYLSRLVWEDLRGPIPPGHEIHHGKGKDDDSIENLFCLPKPVHRALHRNDRKKFLDGSEVKKCKDCKRTLPAECFPLTTSPTSLTPYRRSDCKKCKSKKDVAYKRTWRLSRRCVAVGA
jgi:hypothetical protein